MKKKTSAVLTVYLSMILPILLSLVLALFWGARVHAEHMKVEIVTDISGNAVLGEYNKELRKQYGLLFVDTAYDKGSPAVSNMTERFTFYLKGNTDGTIWGRVGEFLLDAQNYSELSFCDAQIPEYTLATDNNTAVMQRQIFSYMEAEPIEGLLGDSDAQIQQAKSDAESQDATSDDTSILDEVSQNYEKIQNVFSDHSSEDLGGKTAEDLKNENTKNTEDAEKKAKELTSGDKESKGWTVLNMVMEDVSKVSDSSFDPGSVYSGRSDLLKGTGLNEENHVELGEYILFNEYLFEKFGYYGNEKENAHLSYEIEYLIGKKDTDKKNLGAVAWWLLAMRLGMDFVYALNPSSEPGKYIEEITTVLAAIVAPIAEIVKPILVVLFTAVWAFVEARNDVAILMSGGKVPMLKDKESWKTDLDSAMSGKMGENKKGLDYGGYLRVLIAIREVGGVGEETKRMMDIMELDIRKAGYTNFRLDGCVDCFKTTVNLTGESSYNYDFTRYFGYEENAA